MTWIKADYIGDSVGDAYPDDVLEDAVQAASDAVGAVWAEKFPEVKSGDFPPDASFALDNAIREGLEVWLLGNSPKIKHEE